MKPMFVFVESKTDGDITISVDEYERTITKAYESGYEDGKASQPIPYTPTTQYRPAPDDCFDKILRGEGICESL